MPAFVILHHIFPMDHERPTHWDLMLARPGHEELRTWSLDEEPRRNAEIGATQLADHRAAYLEYEGPVSGNRGEVRRWDAGTYREEAAHSIGAASLKFELDGKKLRAAVTAELIDAHAQRWKFKFG